MKNQHKKKVREKEEKEEEEKREKIDRQVNKYTKIVR